MSGACTHMKSSTPQDAGFRATLRDHGGLAMPQCPVSDISYSILDGDSLYLTFRSARSCADEFIKSTGAERWPDLKAAEIPENAPEQASSIGWSFNSKWSYSAYNGGPEDGYTYNFYVGNADPTEVYVVVLW
jgi:hypothetical protein